MIESLTGQGFNVRHACRSLGVSEAGYYAWRGRPDPPRTLRRIWLAGEIAEIHKASGGTYGALRVTAELRYGRDIVVGHNAVESIMRELGIKGLPTRRQPRGARLAQVISLDLVRRSFRRDRPNALWLTDITEHPTREGKLYCCVVLDTFSRLVVGWSIDSTQTTLLVLNALGMATQRREHRDGLVIHSDRGVQGGFNRLSQRLIEEGCDGQAGWMDDGVDGAGGDEVAGEAVAAARCGAALLADDGRTKRPEPEVQFERVGSTLCLREYACRGRRWMCRTCSNRARLCCARLCPGSDQRVLADDRPKFPVIRCPLRAKRARVCGVGSLPERHF